MVSCDPGRCKHLTTGRPPALAKTDPDRAAAVYQTFLAGCYAKVEELDDSSGSFGQFVCDLFCGWIEARQAGLANPDDTVDRLLICLSVSSSGRLPTSLAYAPTARNGSPLLMASDVTRNSTLPSAGEMAVCSTLPS